MVLAWLVTGCRTREVTTTTSAREVAAIRRRMRIPAAAVALIGLPMQYQSASRQIRSRVTKPVNGNIGCEVHIRTCGAQVFRPENDEPANGRRVRNLSAAQ